MHNARSPPPPHPMWKHQNTPTCKTSVLHYLTYHWFLLVWVFWASSGSPLGTLVTAEGIPKIPNKLKERSTSVDGSVMK